MTQVKLYGRANGFGSHAQVTRGFRQALEAKGMLAAFHAVDQTMDHEDRRYDNAPVAIYTGPIECLGTVSSAHARTFVMVAPNSSKIPNQMAKLLKDSGYEILVPSQWAAGVVSGIGNPVHVVPHGVFSEQISWANRPRGDVLTKWWDGEMSFVHYSSSHGQRKGTLELANAWVKLRAMDPSWSKLSLILVLDPLAEQRFIQDFDGPMDGMTVTTRLDGPYQMSGMDPCGFANGMRCFNAVVQPSRGEAFGLIPLEARAAGVPTILTHSTGHTEHVPVEQSDRSSMVIVGVGDESPIDDCPMATAPKVTVDAIVKALRYARNHWVELEKESEQQRKSVLQQWSWENQLAPFLDSL